MKTTIQEADGKVIAVLEGEMDTAAAVEVEKKLKPINETQNKEIVIECTKLEYIASSGLRILLGILKRAKANNNHVVLKNVNNDIKEVFELTGFISIFDFE